MFIINALLVLPAMTALAMPVVTVTNVQEVAKRVYAPEETVIHSFKGCGTKSPCPVPNSPGELVLPRENMVEDIVERVYVPEETVIHSASTSPIRSVKTVPLVPHSTTTVPLVPTSPSELTLPRAEILKREDPIKRAGDDKAEAVVTLPAAVLDKRVPEPILPEFIDTGACICGLLPSQSTAFNNGKIDEMWRCTADAANSIITQGGNGKWYNTTLPSDEQSGVGEPRNWGFNPPYVGEVYVLTFHDEGASYELLSDANMGALHGLDYQCTGTNDTSASTAFYAGQ